MHSLQLPASTPFPESQLSECSTLTVLLTVSSEPATVPVGGGTRYLLSNKRHLSIRLSDLE